VGPEWHGRNRIAPEALQIEVVEHFSTPDPDLRISGLLDEYDEPAATSVSISGARGTALERCALRATLFYSNRRATLITDLRMVLSDAGVGYNDIRIELFTGY
jgi:hypothetical protein